ncbi:RidA family protein [Chelatococcus reniformis]|uniref:RidA family protein n=1 Tax=Chelatococcus reniformis TaxID=1494448 RepID=A0A916X8J8_9HYPH|nr:RidA family protein [Chelatococcus reniformis]GGC50686.1 hypothetical protein GCM10010994_07290 [Chelatococcus reniformis]
MPRNLVSTGSPMEATFGYSRALVDEPFVFVAGTTGYDYATMTLPADAEQQARNAWTTIAEVLESVGFSLHDIVRATYYVTDGSHAEPLLRVCGERPAEIRPAATLLVVAGLLEPATKIEIEVTALRRGR